MAKVIIDIKDNKNNKEKSIVTIKVQSFEKASQTEKNTTSMVYNKVCEILKSLK